MFQGRGVHVGVPFHDLAALGCEHDLVLEAREGHMGVETSGRRFEVCEGLGVGEGEV